MSNHEVLGIVREFFHSAGYVGLILPSGWFGRPYDNLLRLTRSEASDSRLVIELEEQLVLAFEGQPEVAVRVNGLRLVGYSRLVWDWVEFGSSTSHHEEFVEGPVELVSVIR